MPFDSFGWGAENSFEGREVSQAPRGYVPGACQIIGDQIVI